MKALLIAVSLLANTILVALFVSRPNRVPPTFRNYFAWGPASSAAAATPRSAPASKPAVVEKGNASKLWSTLSTDDLHALVERLRAAGFPVYAIRAILQTLLTERYGARMQELIQTDPGTFWKATGSAGMDPKRLAEYRQLASERSNLLRELLGPYLYHDDGTLSSDDARRYGNLAQSKIDQLTRITTDYNELNSQVRASMNGITLPEDREKLALLEREKRADLVALLTPEELADYDMRNSPITNRLRQTFDLFKVTEAEFKTIFGIEEAFDQAAPGRLIDMTPEERQNMIQNRSTAQKEMEAQLRAALGDQRYADFERSNSREYQTLVRLAERDNLPTSAANQAYALRDSLSAESNRVFSDTSLTNDQKHAALQTLAQNTRAQLITTLGPTSGETYVKSANWLSNVERGGAVTFTNNGTSFRSLPPTGASARGGGSGNGPAVNSNQNYFINNGGSSPITSGNGTIYLGGNGGTTIITAPPSAPMPTR